LSSRFPEMISSPMMTAPKIFFISCSFQYSSERQVYQPDNKKLIQNSFKERTKYCTNQKMVLRCEKYNPTHPARIVLS
jgi:hypothetical protein